MVTTTLAPVAACKTLTNTITFGTVMVSFLLTANETGGAYSLMELTMKPGSEPPYHVHEREDETFYIKEGHLSVMVDGEIHECRAGDTIFLPRGIPHTFRVRSAVVKGLLIVTPSGFEKYFQAIGKPAATLEGHGSERPTPDFYEIAGRAASEAGTIMMAEQPTF